MFRPEANGHLISRPAEPSHFLPYEIWAAKVMEMLLKMNQENEQVDSGLAQVYLLGGTFGFWRRGISSYSGAKNGI